MSIKPMILFQPLTPNGVLTTKRIIQSAYMYLPYFDRNYLDRGKGVGRLSLSLGSGWNSTFNEIRQVKVLGEICSSLHLHFTVDVDRMELFRVPVGYKHVSRYFDELRKTLDESNMHALIITGIDFDIIREYVHGVFSMDTITTLGEFDPLDSICEVVTPVFMRRIIGEYDEQQAIDFNS